MKSSYLIAAVALLGLTACNSNAPEAGISLDTVTPKAMALTGSKMDEAAFRRHIKTLASDEFEGRSPSSPGETKTLAYLAAEFKKAGLKPGNGASYFQNVPLVTMSATAQPLTIKQDGVTLQVMQPGPDAVLWSKHVAESVVLQIPRLPNRLHSFSRDRILQVKLTNILRPDSGFPVMPARAPRLASKPGLLSTRAGGSSSSQDASNWLTG